MKQNVKLSKKTIEKLKDFEEVLKKWQKTMNLISPNTVSEIWTRHIMDSAGLYPYIQFEATGRGLGQPFTLLDMGAGAGFPGMVLAIINQTEPGGMIGETTAKGDFVLNVHLVESDIKKCVFMREVLRLLGINATVHNDRIEHLLPFPSDFITARALKDMPQLVAYSKPFITDDTIAFFLKGKSFEEEMALLSGLTAEIIPRNGSGGVIVRVTDFQQKR